MYIYICIFIARERGIDNRYNIWGEPPTNTFHVECVLLFSALTEQEMMCETHLKTEWKRADGIARLIWHTMIVLCVLVCTPHHTVLYIFPAFFRTQAKHKDSIFPKFAVTSYLNKPLRMGVGPRWPVDHPPFGDSLEARLCCQTTCHCLQEFQRDWPWWLGGCWSVGCRIIPGESGWFQICFFYVYPWKIMGKWALFWRSYFSLLVETIN